MRPGFSEGVWDSGSFGLVGPWAIFQYCDANQNRMRPWEVGRMATMTQLRKIPALGIYTALANEIRTLFLL